MLHAALVLARFECARLLGTRRGWVALLALVLVWLLVMQAAILPAARWYALAEPSGAPAVILEALGFATLEQWPVPAMAVYWVVALYLLPLFAVTIAADQMASDRARGTLRFLALRATRQQLYIGRFIGQILIMLVLASLTLLSVLVVIALEDSAALPPALAMAPSILLQVIVVLLPWVALMSLCSVLARSARQATLLAIVFWIGSSLLLGWVRQRWSVPDALEAIVPGAQIGTLVRHFPDDAMRLMVVPAVQCAVLLVAGAVAMQRIRL